MVQFRRLTLDDAGEALTLQRAAFVSEGALYDTVRIPPLMDTFDDLLRELATITIMGAFDGPRMIGSARLTLEGAVGWISRVAVAPDQQGRGVGSNLLREVERLAPASVRRFQLAAAGRSGANIAMYEHLGYAVFERDRDGVGTEMVLMGKDRPLCLLLVSGSLRDRSVNTAVLRTLADIAISMGITATLYSNMRALPAFDPDVDGEAVAEVSGLRREVDAASAVVFSTPEYAGALPGSFKNLLDWTVGSMVLADKPCVWINPSSGPTRASASYTSLRTILGYVGATVVDDACANIALAHGSVTTDGRVNTEDGRTALFALVRALYGALRGGT